MQVTCPVCFSRNAIEAFITDDDARRAVATALKLPAPLSELLLRYIGLFRPRKRALAWSRVARLLDELLVDISRGQVSWKGRLWIAPHGAWQHALEEILSTAGAGKLTLPLESHGYLRAIMARAADKVEAGQEAQTESRRRNRSGEGGPRAISEITADLNHVRRMIEDSTTPSTKQALERQANRLEEELNIAREEK